MASLIQLDRYPWCGHAVVLGRRDHFWRDRNYVLQWFGKSVGPAKKVYRPSECAEHHVSIKLLRSGNRRLAVSHLRKRLTLKLVNERGLSLAETGRQLGLTTSGVAQILRRSQ